MKSTQKALLAAIAVKPDDDLPRLVYADWLEENGRPERAEIIRVQCELARLKAEESDTQVFFRAFEHDFTSEQSLFNWVNWSEVDPAVGRRVELDRRERKLSARHGQEWGRADSANYDGGVLSLRRGLWTSARVSDAPRFLKAITKAPPAIPFDQLDLADNATHESAAALLSTKVFDGITSLVGWNASRAFTSWLGRRKSTRQLREVTLRCTDFDTLGGFDGSANWDGLRELSISQGGDSARWGQQVAFGRAKHFRHLRVLDLWLLDKIPGWLTDELRRGEWRRLRFLAVGPELGYHGVNWLLGAKVCSELRCLKLGSWHPGPAACAFLKSPVLTKLVVLDVGQGISNKPIASLRRVNQPGLRCLSLLLQSGSDVFRLAESPATRNLWVFRPQGSVIDDNTMRGFCNQLRMTQLAVLELDGQPFGAEGAKALANCAGLPNLQALNLQGTPIGVEGAKALAVSPHLTKLKRLIVGEIPPAGLAALKKRFGEDAVG